jgi:putative ATPase
MRSVQALGYPECRIVLGQVVVYLATSAKSNSSYNAINAALATASKTQQLAVPLHLRNSPTEFMKEQGYGAGYLYPHHYDHHYVAQQYLPNALADTVFYTPASNSAEQKIQQYWQAIKQPK